MSVLRCAKTPRPRRRSGPSPVQNVGIAESARNLLACLIDAHAVATPLCLAKYKRRAKKFKATSRLDERTQLG